MRTLMLVVALSLSASPAFAYCASYGDRGVSITLGEPEEDQATFKDGSKTEVCTLSDDQSDPTHQSIDCGNGAEVMVFTDPLAIDEGEVTFRGRTLLCPLPETNLGM